MIKHDKISLRKWQIGVLLVAVIMLAMGIWRDETTFVLRRAINICLGCIGIG